MSVAGLNADMVRGLDSRFPLRDVPEFEKAVNFSGSYEQPIHRWFRYREGFSPSLMKLIRRGDRIYDPFCGCGTALIEAARRQVDAIGTDVNPLAVFVASTKSRRYTPSEVTQFEALATAARGESKGRATPPLMPLLPKLFLPEVLDELLKIKAVIESADKPAVRDLLHLAWISILEDCSNAFKEGNGLKYRYMRRAPGRYVEVPAAIWIPRYFGNSVRGFVQNRWLKATAAISEDIASRSKRWKSPRVVAASCLDRETMPQIGEIDTAIFSPPYANRFDYFEAFKVELWMGGFVSDPKSLRTLRKKSMRNNLTVRTHVIGGVW